MPSWFSLSLFMASGLLFAILPFFGVAFIFLACVALVDPDD